MDTKKGGPPTGSTTRSPAAGKQNLRALVVDDVKDNRELFSLLLTQIGFSHFCGTGSFLDAQKIAASSEEPFDLILLDVRIQDGDGIALCRILRYFNSCCQAPIVMISAMDKEELRYQARVAGATEYIVKPFTTEHLEHIQSLINGAAVVPAAPVVKKAA